MWPQEQSADSKKILNAENVEKLNLPDVPDKSIVKQYTVSPAKVTNSEIEERLKRLKYCNAGNDVNDKVKTKDFDKIMQFKTTRESQVKNAVDAGKSNLEDNDVIKEDLDGDQKCRDDFNTWYWNRVNLKEGKKSVSKSVGTCEGSINEPLTRSSFRKNKDNHCKFAGYSSESVSLGEETFRKSVGIQANVLYAKNMVASDFDDENVNEEKVDAQKGSVME